MKCLNFAVCLSGKRLLPCQGGIQWKQHVPQICCYLSTRPRGIESQDRLTSTKFFMKTKRFVLFHFVWEKLISILRRYVGYTADKFSLFSSGAHVKRRNTPRNFPSISLPTSSMSHFTPRGKFSEILLYVFVY